MWFWFALLTAVAWGLCYTSAEQVIKHVDKSVYYVISYIAGLSFWLVWLTSQTDRSKISLDSVKICYPWLILSIVSSIGGSYLSIQAIQMKNATWASVVEISYPLWCALFAFLFFGHNVVSVTSGVGMLLVIAGTIIFVLGET